MRLRVLALAAATCLGTHSIAAAAAGVEPARAADIAAAERLLGLQFTSADRKLMRGILGDQLENYRKLRRVALANDVAPAFQFNPIPAGFRFEKDSRPLRTSLPKFLAAPSDIETLAFASVAELAELLRSRRVTSESLTRMFLARLEKYDPRLLAVVTLTKELALEQARRADFEIASGQYRGPLHGIPYGVKDLIAVKGYPTTWGAAPFKSQVFESNAAVVEKLEQAGAVLVAKLSLGELAMGDTWFGGQTRNPWDLSRGSSGSSAGSAAAVAAGLVPFAIGSETWGSIVSPATECGVTGLRPTYGRVSRNGAMALSWTMDKIGPLCRSVEDCALVFDAIRGPSGGTDPTVYDLPFNYAPRRDLRGLRIGYVRADFASDKKNDAQNQVLLEELVMLGAIVVPIELPSYPVEDLAIILVAEAAASFDDLTRAGKDDALVQQGKDDWPNIFRGARFIPAVEYIQASRIRHLLIEEMADLMRRVDLYVAPSLEGNNCLLTNLTGHPAVVLPNGFNEEGRPVSVTFTGRLFDEATLLSAAKVYQDAMNFHTQHPNLKSP